MPMNILAKNGPATGENSYTYIALYNDDINLQLYGSDADTVEGAVYDTATNTLTLTNYNHPELWLETNMMGDDFKLRLTGENHLASVSIWGAGWGGSLEITGDGSLTINENKTRKYAIYFGAEGTQGALKIGDNVTLTAYKGESYVVAIAGTKSTTFPVSGNFEEALTLTDDSGIEGEIWKFDNVIKEDSYDRTLQVATKAGDDKLYGIYMYKDDDGDGEQNQKTSVYELIKVDGLASGNEYVAALIDSAKVYAWPEGYTADANGATVTARECTMESMEEIKKDNETFYWGGDEVVYGESGWGESKYSVYQAVLDEVTMKHWTGEMRTGKLVVQTEQRNLTFNNELDSKQVLSVIEKYNTALELLDAYDHQTMLRPKGNEATYILSYEECMNVISSMRFGDESDLFGKEKDDSTLVALTIMIAESRPEEKEMMISVIMNCIN